MNLNTIIATTSHAQVPVTLKGFTPCRLPVFAVGRRLSTSPEVALSSGVPAVYQLLSALLTAANFVFLGGVKGASAYLANSIRARDAAPSIGEITSAAAVWSRAVGRRLVEDFRAVLTGFFGAGFAGVHASILPLKRSYWELAKRNLGEAREHKDTGLFNTEEIETLEAEE